MSDTERQRDKARIDKAIGLLEEEMAAGGMETVALGAKALVLLLERRSKLLGLDSQPGAGEADKQPSAVARILAAVPKG